MTSPYDVLARIRSTRAPEPVGERCEMCSEFIADEHQHVVNVAGRQLMCVCRGCYLLFTDSQAELRYRAVPDRYLAFPGFALDRRAWEALQIPVGMAFFFRNSGSRARFGSRSNNFSVPSIMKFLQKQADTMFFRR